MDRAVHDRTRPGTRLPDDGLLQHECEDWRWYVRVDGAFFQTRGDAPYPVVPARVFDGEQLLRLRRALLVANLPRLAAFRTEPEGEGASDFWTVPGAVVEVGEREGEPLSISILRAVVEGLVADSRTRF